MRTGRLGQSACLILRRMPHTLRRVEPVPGPAGYFANGGLWNVGGAYRGPWFSCRDTLTACRIHPEIEEFFCPTWRIIWPGGVVLIDTPRTNTAVTIQVRVSTIDVPWSG